MPGYNMNIEGFKVISKYDFGWVPTCLLLGEFVISFENTRRRTLLQQI
jgi:hypothetical protein